MRFEGAPTVSLSIGLIFSLRLGPNAACDRFQYKGICRKTNRKPLAECEVKRVYAGIKEFDLKGSVLDSALLANELIQARLSNLPYAVWGGISSTIFARREAIQCHLKADGLAVFRRS